MFLTLCSLFEPQAKPHKFYMRYDFPFILFFLNVFVFFLFFSSFSCAEWSWEAMYFLVFLHGLALSWFANGMYCVCVRETDRYNIKRNDNDGSLLHIWEMNEKMCGVRPITMKHIWISCVRVKIVGLALNVLRLSLFAVVWSVDVVGAPSTFLSDRIISKRKEEEEGGNMKIEGVQIPIYNFPFMGLSDMLTYRADQYFSYTHMLTYTHDAQFYYLMCFLYIGEWFPTILFTLLRCYALF